MKKLFTFLLALIASVGIASAQSGTCGDNHTWTLSDSVLTISGTGAMADYTSASSVPWHGHRSAIKTVLINDGVTSIGDFAFYECSSLTSITIPNSVTSIGRIVFYGCFSLTSVTIPNSVTSIGDQAFLRCKSLTSITIPDSVTSIGDSAFGGCSSLTSITIPNSVTSIGNSAFNDCSSLTSVTIPNSVTSIGDFAFSGCSSLTSVTIPNSVTSIGDYAFHYCESLTSVTIPNSVASIGSYAFSLCYSLTSITIPNSVTSIGDGAFSNCYSLTSVTIPNSVTSIGNSAFRECSSLTSVTIPNSVTSIGENAFNGCYSLKSMIVESANTVYDSRENCNAIIETATNTLIVGCQNTIIPNSVTSIGYAAFARCTSLTSITIPNSVTSIGNSAFLECSSLTSVTIGNSVTSIGHDAFWYCESLTSVTIPDSVTSIGDAAFWGCFSLTSVTIGNSVTSIGSSAFESCTSLTSITIPNSVTSIGSYAFYRCKSLTSIIIPDSVTSIGDGAFSDCSSLTSLTIPNSVTGIGSDAFLECSGLTSVTFEGSTPPAFSEDVFYLAKECPIYVPCGTKEAYVAALNVNNTIDESRVIEKTFIASGYCGADSTNLTWELSCDSILTISGTGEMVDWNYGEQNYAPWHDYSNFVVTVILPDGLTHIGQSAFIGCSKLQNINIPNTVTSVGENALTESSNPLLPIINGIRYADTYLVAPINNNLSSYIIEEGTKWIGTHAFYTVAISSITIPNSVIGIGSRSFIYTGLTEITIPNSVETIGNAAFYDCNHLKDVIIGSGVKWIGYHAFSDCNSLSSITCKAVIPPVLEEARVFRYTSKTIPLYVPAESIDAYKAAEEWKEFINILPIEEDPARCLLASGTCGAQGDNLTWELSCDSVLTISGTGAMADYTYSTTPWYKYRSSIKSVIITDGVTSIGMFAFDNCTSLTSVTIPNSVISIGGRAFSGCSSLTSVTIPNSVTSIGDVAFADCSSLTSITIPDSVTSIENSAFRDCSSLTSVTFEGSAPPVFGYAVFYNTNNCLFYVPCGTKDAYVAALIERDIDESRVIEKSPYTYSVASSDNTLGSVTITQEPTCTEPVIFRADAAEGYQFTQWSDGNTDNPRSLILTQDTTLTAEFELAQCLLASGTCGAQGDNLTWELSCDSVLTISGTGAMADYTSGSSVPWYGHRSAIKTVLINDGVTSIGDRAFYDCSSLTSVTIGDSVTSIGYAAFRSCSSLTSINVDANNSNYSSVDGVLFNKDKTTLVAYPEGKQGAYTIPNSVTSIGDHAFRGCSSLTSVTIPNSVTSIGEYAFFNCTSLTSVTIPNSVTSIGNSAFIGCSSLKSMIVESGNTVYDSRENCNAIIETATNTLIAGCQNTIIPNSVTSIGSDAFYSCSSLTSITIPNSVTSIGYEAFNKCSSLTSITIPNSVTSIGDRVFYDCSSLTSVTIGNSVTSIGDFAFYNCSSLSSVTIPNSVTSIGGHAFSNCFSLTSVTIPNSVTSISSWAFDGCKSLTSVTIPNSVTRIGDYAFKNCSSLTSVTFEGSAPPVFGYAVFYNTNNCLFYVPCGTKDAYVAALIERDIDESRVIEKTFIASGYCGADSTNLTWELSCDSVLTISGTGAMADYFSYTDVPWYSYRDSILSVVISDSVTSIGNAAFNGCSSLTSVTIGNSVTSIGGQAFYKCSSLTSVTVGNSVTSIGNYAFYGCSSLTSITIPNSVTRIVGYAFQGCSSLTSIDVDTNNPNYCSIDGVLFNKDKTTLVAYPGGKQGAYTIPNSVTSIGYRAFYGCSSLTSVTIGESVTSIGNYAFKSCSSLTSVTIPNSVTSIGYYVFEGCSSLPSVTIPNSVTSIGNAAFNGCSSLTSMTIGNSVTSIGSYAFNGCTSLTSVTIPNSVTSIGSYAFGGCTSLTSVTFESITPPIIEKAYYNTNNCPIYVPCGTKEAYVAALNINNTIDESRVIEIEELMFDYTISSDNTLGSVTITQEPTCTAPLIFRADAAEGYQFTQWSDGNTDNPRSLILTQDTTLKAEFELCTYIVTWLNYDSLVLELDTNVAYGTMPSYDSAVPAKPSTAEYTYTFAGWSPVVESVTGHTTYIAVFDEVLNAYTVTWLNYDSLVLELDTNVIYGTMPSYDGTLPAKPSTAEYTYTFAGWSPEVVATTEDATYTATYTSALRTYSVLVYGMNDNIILNGTYPYGESVLVEAIPEQNYQFAQWSDGNTDNPRSLILTQDTTLKALFEQIIIEQDTIIVTDSTDISDIITGGQDTIPHVEVQPGGEITIDRDDIGIGVITIITIGTESGQVHPWDGGYDNLKNTRVVMEYVLEPLKQQADPNKWYAFAVPFEVDIETGITRKYGNKSHVPGKDFMILEYDSELRAKTGSGWVEKKSGLLEPGYFYMLGIEGNCNRWLFEKVRDADVVGDKEKPLQHYAHGNSKNDGWHGLGNTTLEYVDMSFDGLNATYVYIYDNQHGRYNIYSIEELILAVGQPFFTQGDNAGSVAFTPNNGKGKGNGKKNMPIYAPSYDVQPSHPRVLLTIETEKINATPDRLYITLHDDNQCGSYRIGRDFMRMDKGCKQVPNFWCPMADGTQLSAHGISMPTTYTTIPLGIFTPAKGEYTINAHMQDMNDYIVELYYQNVCLGIVMQGVPFRLEMAAGTSYEYSIRISRRVSTDLNPAEDTQCDKDNKWYDVLGRPLPQDAHGIFIRKGEKIIK